MDWTRYAVYWAPEGRLGALGAAWLGWDIHRGRAVNPPAANAPKARRYGFHATLKPPFRLAEGRSEEDLAEAARAVARSLPPTPIGVLSVSRDHGFLALRPSLRDPVARAAERFVSRLDEFRAPTAGTGRRDRRFDGLTPRQRGMLLRWGYPHVMDDFHPHLTLSGSSPSDDLVRKAGRHFDGTAGAERSIRDVSLVGEDSDGFFHVIEKLHLGPPSSG